MNYDEALAYIHAISWTGSRPGLSRIKELCALMGNIQDKLKYVHIAGTNGKGSLATMLTDICIASGMRVGTFTSPFVFRFNERIAVDGKPISDEALADIISRIKPLAQSMKDSPTEFELITAAGFLYFYEQHCDIVVLEAGMGGRLDSTNIISTPVLCAITGVALDHTAILGDTTEKIAHEKGGIIKPTVPVIVGKVENAAFGVISGRAAALHSELRVCDYSRVSNVRLSLDATSFNFCPYKEPFSTSLIGRYQVDNAAMAISAAEMLGLGDDAIRSGIAASRWPARFEVLTRDPMVIYDGGHNPDGVAATMSTTDAILGGRVNILAGVMADKNYKRIIELVAPRSNKVFCVTPDNPRALDADVYAAAFKDVGCDAKAYGSMDEAVAAAYAASKADKLPLLAMGSLYMYHDFCCSLEKL